MCRVGVIHGVESTGSSRRQAAVAARHGSDRPRCGTPAQRARIASCSRPGHRPAVQAREPHLAQRIGLACEFVERRKHGRDGRCTPAACRSPRRARGAPARGRAGKRGAAHAQVVGEHRTREAESPAQLLLDPAPRETRRRLVDLREQHVRDHDGREAVGDEPPVRQQVVAELGQRRRSTGSALCESATTAPWPGKCFAVAAMPAARMPCMQARASVATTSGSR